MNFNDRLVEYMNRSVAYGASAEEVGQLIAQASEAGCATLAGVLAAYGAALEKGDRLSAAKYFAMLHIFTEA